MASILLLVPPGTLAEPTVTVTDPEEGGWSTSPDITVEGTSAPGPTINATIGIPELGPGTGQAVVLEGGALVLHPLCHFTDDFDGDALDTSVWTTVGTEGRVEVYGGSLRLFNDSRGDYPLVQSGLFWLPATDWTVELRARFTGFISGAQVGAGLTSSKPDMADSYAAALVEHSTTANDDVIEVFADGTMERTISNDGSWHTYAVGRSVREDLCEMTLDGDTVSDVDTFTAFAFWFGRVFHSSNPHYPTANIDYVDIWTFSGDWTSDIHDMGSMVLLEGASPNWSSTWAASKGPGLELRCSTDGSNWSAWTPCAGTLDAPVPCRYVEFRLALSLEGVKDEGASLAVRSIDIRYRSPIARVEVRTAGGDWSPASGTDRWTARVGLHEDGNTIEARAVDASGDSATTSVNVTLDTTPPVGTVRVKGLRPFTNDTNVTLLLDATDRYGVVAVGVAHYPDFYGERIYPYAAELPWRIQGGLGENPIYVRFYDAHGLVSAPVCATVAFDSRPPSGHVVINGGAPYTQSQMVRLDLDSSDEVGMLSLELSNDPGMADPRALPVGTRTLEDWALAEGGDGPRTVYMRLIDLAGNIAVVNASIELYVPKALGRVSIEDGAAVTNRTIVRVRVDAPAELRARRMQLSRDPGFGGAVWEDVAAEKLFILAPGDGEVRIYARFMDFRGFHSLPINSSIVLDTTPPALAILIDGGARYTTDATVSVSVSYDDHSPVSRMWRCADGRFDLAQPTPFEGLFDWTVPATEGDWRVHVMVEDAADNIAVATASIHFAALRPKITLVFPGGAASNATTRLTANVTWRDPYGGVEVQLALDTDPPEGAAWQPANGPVWVDVPAGTQDGDHKVHARARNTAGLVSDVSSWRVTLDRTPPRIVVLEPADGAVLHQTALRVRVRVGVEDLTGVASASFRLDGGKWQPLDDLANLTGRAMAGAFGAHALEVRVTDAASNTGTTAITFDLERPEQRSPPGWSVVLVIAFAVAAAVATIAMSRRGGDCKARPPHG